MTGGPSQAGNVADLRRSARRRWPRVAFDYIDLATDLDSTDVDVPSRLRREALA